ncbi:hypothetical protein [Saccharothrix coeruleofusca]|uniref:Uncharacterized protein n=1 Tax=Saccharothrix coeruleofusca TaxID=33919 RepID=A0A918ANB2_9PSEU|nr:hypothetical protein [Saccharothrix coeruleofusca]MBP2337887.1 hypothetical protein [Saccharothrix coeruleofusca]GGP62950.1 hypothetical protein GCM10010185_39330 [Saccharothrix coeruleofusca]
MPTSSRLAEPVPYESMTVQVRAGLGERRLVAAADALRHRHEELRRGGVSAHRVVAEDDLERQAGAVAVGGTGALELIWLDAGEESGRLVLVARRDVLAELPWHVLLPELVSEWKTH